MKIVQYPHPALRHRARSLNMIDQKVVKIAEAMLELMYEAKGLGLAAPQVALPYQMFVMNILSDPQSKELERVYINPEIVDRKGSVEGEEGCLSFPGLYQKVRRAKSIVFRAYNLKGELVEVSAVDLEARVLQHETDHLLGVLFIDKMGPIGKLESRNTIKKFEHDYLKSQKKGEIPPDVEIEKTLKELERGLE